MDSNDKWVWADETDSSLQSLPLLDRKLTTIVEWPDLPPDPSLPAGPPVPAESAEPAATKTPEAPVVAAPIPEVRVEVKAHVKAPDKAPVEVPAPVTPPANARRDISATVVRATVLHLEGQIEQAIQEIETGLRNGEPEAELYCALGALQMDLERFEDAAKSCREVLRREPDNKTCKHNL